MKCEVEMVEKTEKERINEEMRSNIYRNDKTVITNATKVNKKSKNEIHGLKDC